MYDDLTPLYAQTDRQPGHNFPISSLLHEVPAAAGLTVEARQGASWNQENEINWFGRAVPAVAV